MLSAVVDQLRVRVVSVIEGPVERSGETAKIRSVYVRDPDKKPDRDFRVLVSAWRAIHSGPGAAGYGNVQSVIIEEPLAYISNPLVNAAILAWIGQGNSCASESSIHANSHAFFDWRADRVSLVKKNRRFRDVFDPRAGLRKG
jgi:hypothetical protein